MRLLVSLVGQTNQTQCEIEATQEQFDFLIRLADELHGLANHKSQPTLEVFLLEGEPSPPHLVVVK